MSQPHPITSRLYRLDASNKLVKTRKVIVISDNHDFNEIRQNIAEVTKATTFSIIDIASDVDIENQKSITIALNLKPQHALKFLLVLDENQTAPNALVFADEQCPDELKQQTSSKHSHVSHAGISDKYLPLAASHPFYELVRTLENSKLVNGRFIKFESPVPDSEFRLPSCGIFVRECYPRLKDLIFANKSKPIHLGGTPGTGKSAFMCYLLFCVIHAHDSDWPKDSHEKDFHSILFDTGKQRKTGVYWWRRGQSILSIDGVYPLELLSDPGVLQLAECESENGPLVISKTTTVIAASPRKYDQANIHKISGLKSFYMPVWSLEELIECLQNIYNESSPEKIAILKRLFKVFGGVPRSVIVKGVREIESDSRLENYIDELKEKAKHIDQPHKILDQVDFNTEYGKGQQYHSLVHFAVDDRTFEKTGLVFASREIGDLIEKACWEHSRSGMIEFLNGCLSSSSSISGSTAGYFFEKGAIKILIDGGEFHSARAFYTASNESSEETFMTRFTKCTRVIRYDSLKDVKEMLTGRALTSIEQILFVPESTNNPTFDAFSFPNNVFQFTISHRHDCKPSATFKELMNLMRSFSKQKLNFYWVLPDTQAFDRFAITPTNNLRKEEIEIQNQMDEQLVHIKLKVKPTSNMIY